MEDLPGSSLCTIVVCKTLKILRRGANLCPGNAISMIGVVRYTTQFFVLDKAKALPIRLGSQTAWDAVRLDFIDNKEKRLALRLHFGMIPVISGFLNAC